MRRAFIILVAVALVLLATAVSAQQDAVVGSWRGTLKSAQGGDSSIIMTIVKRGDSCVGATTGLSEGGVPLQRLVIEGTHVTVEAVPTRSWAASC